MAATSKGKALVTRVVTEFEDVDSYGIAHHTKLVAYLERARVRLFTKAGLDLQQDRILPVLSNLQMRFRQPIKILDEIDVEVWIKGLDDYRVTLAYRLRRQGITVAQAETTLAFTNLDAPGICPVPEKVVAGMKPYLPPS